ncbi:neuropilin and tolloid-like protein 1 [Rhincodon typus]|uniref:neuropilin and tolloid-like protein 1 n=1 Tax=Rhincodon typus TaxID=259920 RepID=UPI00202FF01C|nr:neuropilin and tolloid-like protein 1 [Rhincodon typus]
MVHGYQHGLLHVVSSLILLGLCVSTKKTSDKPTSSKSVQCGSWIKNPDGGFFTSPNYPNKYPPDRECTYIIEAAPRQSIELYFDEKYSIEPSWECKFDHIEVRDGPFGFSTEIGRYCGQNIPPFITSSGRYLWIKFVADGELESIGFLARYNFIPDPEFAHLGALKPLPACEFEMGGPEGIIESKQAVQEGKANPTEAVDCKWYIRAPPKSKIYLRFLDYEMENSNECKRNFVAIYDGSNAVEDLKAKFCSTVANDLMLRTGLGVIRMWADEGSRSSHFQMLFTSFQEQKRKANLLDQLTNTSGTIIGVTSFIVIILIVISVIVQIKQPRKKYIQRKPDFDQTVFQEVFEPTQYELCSLKGKGAAADLGDIVDDFENYHKLRRSSSKCIHDHHCGSQISSIKGSRSNLSTRDATILSDIQPQPVKPSVQSLSRRSILVMKHSYSQDAADACDIDEIEEVPTTSHRLSRNDKSVQRLLENNVLLDDFEHASKNFEIVDLGHTPA